jgi:hypothetical protein
LQKQIQLLDSFCDRDTQVLETMASEPHRPRKGRKPLAPSKKREGVLKLKFVDADRGRLDHAAELDKLETNPWSRRVLNTVAEYRVAGISLEIAYSMALDALEKTNPLAYEKIRAALDSVRKR